MSLMYKNIKNLYRLSTDELASISISDTLPEDLENEFELLSNELKNLAEVVVLMKELDMKLDNIDCYQLGVVEDVIHDRLQGISILLEKGTFKYKDMFTLKATVKRNKIELLAMLLKCAFYIFLATMIWNGQVLSLLNAIASLFGL